MLVYTTQDKPDQDPTKGEASRLMLSDNAVNDGTLLPSKNTHDLKTVSDLIFFKETLDAGFIIYINLIIYFIFTRILPSIF